MLMTIDRPCTHCDRPATSGELCEMHRGRLRRGAPMHTPVQERLPPDERHEVAALKLADAEEDADFAAARSALKYAGDRAAKMRAGRKAALARWHKTTPAERQRIAKQLANKRWKKLSAEGKMRARTHQGASDGGKGRKGQIQTRKPTAQPVPEREVRQPGRTAEDSEAAAGPGAVPSGGDAGDADQHRPQRQGEVERPNCRGGLGARPGGPEADPRGEGTGDA